MPSFTVRQLTPILGSYVEPDGDFVSALSQVIPRIYALGLWRDLVYQTWVTSEDGVVHLPDDAEALLACTVEDNPAAIRSLWHDIKITGRRNVAGIAMGVIDDGLYPTFRQIETPTNNFYVVPASDSRTGRSFDPADGEAITVRGVDGARTFVASALIGTPSILFLSATGITAITEIAFEGLIDRYEIRTDESDPATTLAVVGPAGGMTRYRRYRVSDPVQAPVTVHMLVKRAAPSFLTDDTVIHLGNINALKHGLLGRLAEDNADIERAEYHWQICARLLDDELDAHRGAARPTLKIAPFGSGGIANIM